MDGKSRCYFSLTVISLTVILHLAVPVNSAGARQNETLRNRTVGAQVARQNRKGESPSLEILINGKNQENKNALVVNAEVFDAGKSLRLPTSNQMRRHLCDRQAPSVLCTNWAQVVKSYEETAAVLGIPASYMMCITKQETRFGRLTNTSTAGAKGMNQFMDDTARSIAELINTNPKYRRAYEQYAQKTGCKTSVTKEAIQSTNFATSFCVANFAMAVHMRRDMGPHEAQFAASMGAKSSPSVSNTENVLKFLIVSYNAGPGRGLQYKNNSFQEGKLPQETKGYIDGVMNKCLKEAAKLPDTPLSSRSGPQ